MRRSSASIVAVVVGCHGSSSSPAAIASPITSASATSTQADVVRTAVDGGPSLPLQLVSDADLPGKPVRFDYQDVDVAKGHLVIAHMNDASVVVVSTRDGSIVKVLSSIPTPRGVAVASDVGRIFVTSSPSTLVIIDSRSLSEIARVPSGSGPDGVAWDPIHKVVGVSDQRDGAISLIADSGSGVRRQVHLGNETGNVVFDPSRASFWITVERSAPPDQLVNVDPVAARITRRIPLPGCAGAHGLRVHPDGTSAFIACEASSKVMRVDLTGTRSPDLAASGADPDVLAIDPALGWLYVAAESGDLKVFDIQKPGLVLKGSEHPGDASHSVAVDPATHHVFFPLTKGNSGTPVLRIMRPSGI